MNNRMSLRSLFLFALLVVSGIAGALYLRATLVADDTVRLAPIPDHSALEAQERAKPRFVGEIGGIFLAPQGTPVPEKYTTFEDLCGDTLTEDVPDDLAGALELSLELPKEYVLQENDINTGVIACGNTVTAARKAYTYALPQYADEAYITVGRSILGYDEIDVAYDRPKTLVVAGREVVIVEPITDDGYIQYAAAWIPEPFGDTFIHSSGLPRIEFLKLVELVASSTRTQ
ncbi:MAG: hypothetical protein AMXMBFR44_1670 [Candidatus Campbellbacteria bacterium]